MPLVPLTKTEKVRFERKRELGWLNRLPEGDERHKRFCHECGWSNWVVTGCRCRPGTLSSLPFDEWNLVLDEEKE